jgi:hypothetical protein
MSNFESISSRDWVDVRHSISECKCVDMYRSICQLVAELGDFELTDQNSELRRIHSMDPKLLLEQSVDVLGKHRLFRLSSVIVWESNRDPPVEAFQILAVLSVDPAIKNSLSGDQARSYTCLPVTLLSIIEPLKSNRTYGNIL